MAPPETTHDRSYRASAGFGAAGFGVVALVGLASTIISARIFGVKVVGDYALVYAPVAAMWVLSTVQEQPALIRHIATMPVRAPSVTGVWLAVFAFSTGLTLAVSLLVACGAYFAFHGFLHQPDLYLPALVCLAGYVLIQNPVFNLDGIFYAYVAGRDFFWINAMSASFVVVATVACGWLFDDVWGLIAATYGAATGALLIRLVFVRRYMRLRVSREHVRGGFRELPGMLRFGARMAPGNVFAAFSNQSATWILGGFAPVSVVGAFNRGQMIARRFDDLSTRITRVLFPTLVARRARRDHVGFDRALMDTLRYLVILGLWVGSVGAGAAHGVMAMFGPGFGQASGALALLLFLPALMFAAAVQTQGLYAVNRPGITSWLAAGRLVITTGVAIFATKRLGIEGPAIGLLAGALFLVVANAIVLEPHLTLRLAELWPYRQMVGLVLASAVGFAAARAMESLIPGVWVLPVALPLGATAFALALLVVGGLNDADRQRIRAVVARAPSRAPWTTKRSEPAGAPALSGPSRMPNRERSRVGG